MPTVSLLLLLASIQSCSQTWAQVRSMQTCLFHDVLLAQERRSHASLPYPGNHPPTLTGRLFRGGIRGMGVSKAPHGEMQRVRPRMRFARVPSHQLPFFRAWEVASAQQLVGERMQAPRMLTCAGAPAVRPAHHRVAPPHELPARSGARAGFGADRPGLPAVRDAWTLGEGAATGPTHACTHRYNLRITANPTHRHCVGEHRHVMLTYAQSMPHM